MSVILLKRFHIFKNVAIPRNFCKILQKSRKFTTSESFKCMALFSLKLEPALVILVGGMLCGMLCGGSQRLPHARLVLSQSLHSFRASERSITEVSSMLKFIVHKENFCQSLLLGENKLCINTN